MSQTSTNKTNLYDGLFLISPFEMGGDLAGALDHVREMLDRAGAEVLSLRKWDERQLAYKINSQKRGVYLLALFRVDPTRIANIQRECNLSEMVMRELLLTAEHLGEAEIEQEVHAAQTTRDEAALTAEEDESSEGPSTEDQATRETAQASSMDESDAGSIPDQGSTQAQSQPQPVGQSA